MERRHQTTSVKTSISCSKEPVTGLDPLLQPFVDQDNNPIYIPVTTVHENQKSNFFRKYLSYIQGFSGIIYLLISSLLFTSSNFLIKQLHVVILDVILIRCIIQIFISIGFFIYKGYRPLSSHYFNLLMFIYSLFAAAGTVCFYLSLSYIPLPDLTTIRYTQVIWTVLLSFIIFRERITLSRILACILTLIGVIYVVQPSFIFSKSINLNETLYKSLPKNNEKHFGMLIALLCAFSISISIILNKKLLEKKFHQSIIMFYFILTSFFMLLIMQIYYWIFSKLNDEKFDIKKVYFTKKFLYATILATSQLIPMILTQKSIKREHPSIISVIQACDILFTIILEKLFSTTILNIFTLIGSTLVLTSIVIVGIEKLWQDRCNKRACITPSNI